MATRTVRKVALLWHGNRDARQTVTLEKSGLHGVAEALSQVGIEAEPAVYADEFVEEVLDQILKVDGVLVWVNPIVKGGDRSVLDEMLRQVSDEGIFVSTHPEVIQKMGTKEVLFRTRDMSWGSDTHLYTSVQEFRERFPVGLAEGQSRVLKQNRGNGGNGVWKAELVPKRAGTSADSGLDRALDLETSVLVRHARRGSVEETMPLGEFLTRCEQHFSGSGRIIDQAYQERLPEGMVRCYLVRDEVVGFGHQLINALFPASPGMEPGEVPQPGPRLYYPATKPDFQILKKRMEEEWVPAMCRVLDIDTGSLPVIWDADFLYGPKTAAGEDTHVLCEINVSAVYPFPTEALVPLARETDIRLQESFPARNA